MNRRAGLTLVEVLAALVLMGTVAGATLPLLRGAARTLADEGPDVSAMDLARAADALVLEPESLGLEETPVRGRVALPGHPAGAVDVRLLRAEGSDVDHAWLAVSAGGRTVFRRLAEAPRHGGEDSR